MTDSVQHRLDSHSVNRRPHPETIPELEARCCWHCHNPESMMHILECPDCGWTLMGPVVQDHGTCDQCGETMECVRYTSRYVHPDDREDGGKFVGKRCYHPETGEQMHSETLREEGFR